DLDALAGGHPQFGHRRARVATRAAAFGARAAPGAARRFDPQHAGAFRDVHLLRRPGAGEEFVREGAEHHAAGAGAVAGHEAGVLGVGRDVRAAAAASAAASLQRHPAAFATPVTAPAAAVLGGEPFA